MCTKCCNRFIESDYWLDSKGFGGSVIVSKCPECGETYTIGYDKSYLNEDDGYHYCNNRWSLEYIIKNNL